VFFAFVKHSDIARAERLSDSTDDIRLTRQCP
jgi:hypothetical protein